jgi:hypothetical protein
MEPKLTIDEAMKLIGDLLLAYTVGNHGRELRYLYAICEALCGQRPTKAQIREYIDADFGE